MSSKPSKPSWVEDMAVDDSSDLEESWAGEEVMFDGSPSSGMYVFLVICSTLSDTKLSKIFRQANFLFCNQILNNQS